MSLSHNRLQANCKLILNSFQQSPQFKGHKAMLRKRFPFNLLSTLSFTSPSLDKGFLLWLSRGSAAWVSGLVMTQHKGSWRVWLFFFLLSEETLLDCLIVPSWTVEEKDVGLGSQKGKIRALTDTEKMVFCKINKDFFFNHQNRKPFKAQGA